MVVSIVGLMISVPAIICATVVAYLAFQKVTDPVWITRVSHMGVAVFGVLTAIGGLISTLLVDSVFLTWTTSYAGFASILVLIAARQLSKLTYNAPEDRDPAVI